MGFRELVEPAQYLSLRRLKQDAYNFDPERVAQLLKNPGVSEEELVDAWAVRF